MGSGRGSGGWERAIVDFEVHSLNTSCHGLWVKDVFALDGGNYILFSCMMHMEISRGRLGSVMRQSFQRQIGIPLTSVGWLIFLVALFQ